MATIAGIVVKIAGDSKDLRKELNAVQRQIRSTFGYKGLEASKKAVTILGGITASVGALGVATLKLAGDIEQTKVAFTSMLNSGQKAEAFLKDLKEFAASTPFGFNQVKGAAQKFLAFGFSAEQVLPVLTAVGDSAAALGMGQDGIDRLALALGQMAAKGKTSAEEMRQLGEVGVPVWQMLADSLGMSVSEAMDEVSRGVVDAQTGLEAIVKGMDAKFGGMMDKQSKAINGLVASIKDNVINVAQDIGSSLADALDLRERLSGVSQWLQEFSQAVQKSGIKQAIADLVPKSVIVAIGALGGAILTLAIPALASMGYYAVVTYAALLPYIAIGVAIGGAFALLYSSGLSVSEMFAKMGISTNLASETWTVFKETIKNVCSAIVGYIKLLAPVFVGLGMVITLTISGAINIIMYLVKIVLLGVNSIAQMINDLVATLNKGFTWIGDLLRTCIDDFGTWAKESLGFVGEFCSQAMEWLGGIIDTIKSVKNALVGVKDTDASVTVTKKENNKDGIVKRAQKAIKGINFGNFSSGIGSGNTGGSATGGGGGKLSTKSPLDSLTNEAQMFSARLDDVWSEMFKTRTELVDKWYAEESAQLEKSKAVNEYYERDKTRLAEVYAQKRIDALKDEATTKNNIHRKLRDMAKGFKDNLMVNDKASDKKAKELERDYTNAMDAIKDKWQDLELEYMGYTQAEKDIFIKNLEEQGLAYQKLGDDRISLEANVLAEQKALQQKYQDDVIAMHNNAMQAKADIDRAYALNDFEQLKELLTAKQAEQINNAEATKSIMDAYKQAVLDANVTTANMIGELYSSSLNSMEDGITNILEGTKSIGGAMQELGHAITKVISQYIAKWVAGRIMQTVIGGKQSATEVAMAKAQGSAIASAFRPAAYYASVASMGVAQSFGLSTIAIGEGLGMPMLANGGVAYAPTIAMIGEGKYKEAVLPLNDNTYSQIGKGISESGGGTTQIVVNAPLDGRRAVVDYFKKHGDEISEGLGLANGVSVDYGGALT